MEAKSVRLHVSFIHLLLDYKWQISNGYIQPQPKPNTLIASNHKLRARVPITQLCNAVYKCLLELSGKHQIVIISVTELATIVGYRCFWGTHWSFNESEPTIHLHIKCMLKCLSYSHYSQSPVSCH